MASDLTGAAFLSRLREQRDFPIPSQPEIRVGYDRSNDVRIPYEGVSRHHAKIAFDGKDYWIEDVGSANGTYLNAARLSQRERLKHLDVVTLGRRADLIFVRRSADVPRKTKLGILAARLEIQDGLDAGTLREIPRGSVTIGRTAGNNIVADSQLVSKVHARIERSGVELVLTDLQSANGTFVNGEKIDSRALKNGDEISIGRARSYRVRIEQGEVLTGDVAVSDKVSTTSNPSLPMDWKTHLEWSPEELAEFDKARAKLRPSGPGVTDKQGARGETAPAPKVEDGKLAKAAAPAAKPAEKKEKPEAPRPKAETPKPAAAAAPEPTAPKPEPVKPAPTPAPTPTPTPVAAAPAPAPPVATAAKPPAAKPAPPSPPPAAAPPSSAPVSAPPAAAPPSPPSPPSPASPAVVSPVAALPAPRDATATRALTPEQLPRVFLESPVRTFPLSLGTFAIGRDPAADVRLEGSEVSRHHARLVVTEQDAVLEDLRTVNGTYVNKEKLVAPRALADGDEVAFGSLRFKIRFGAGFPAKRT
jgi:pSer/pThr/pTyr-binding forkhead associated (FHA) protein